MRLGCNFEEIESSIKWRDFGMYKSILLATELGSESWQVQDKAVSIQKLTGAKLSIIHITDPVPTALSVDEYSYGTDYQQASEEIVKEAKKLLMPIVERLGIKESNMIIGSGKPSREILAYAREKDIDLIVTGSHGRSGLKLLLGSTATAILHGSKCDVLAVRFIEP
jgi:universal stress protein A